MKVTKYSVNAGPAIAVAFGVFLFLLFIVIVVSMTCWAYVYRIKTKEELDDELSHLIDIDLEACFRNNKITEIKDGFTKANVNTSIRKNGSDLSPLAVAAQHGHVIIMEYFISLGANLEYVQKSTKKGIFHFACVNAKQEVIYWCIDHQLPINAVDSRKQTPLMVYIKTNKPILTPHLKCLIKAGANINKTDKDNCSVLYYVCQYSYTSMDVAKRNIISLIIKAGCIHDHNISGKQKGRRQNNGQSSLCKLLLKDEMRLCRLLIEAGYNLHQDSGLQLILHDLPEETRLYMNYELQNTSSLQRLCRTTIRKQLDGIKVHQRLKLLTLPKKIIRFLQLEDLIVNIGNQQVSQNQCYGARLPPLEHKPTVPELESIV